MALLDRKPGQADGSSSTRRHRPTHKALLGAVVELVGDEAGPFRATARRYSLCTADADDAYQRGLEILMTKAPTADLAELRPWLHTVIKHEALAVRRQRERLLPNSSGAAESGPGGARAGDVARGPDESAAERERVLLTAATLRELKPGELQCLLLKALGYSYHEISAHTGFSWTKVNRCLTEGRRRFFDTFARIESGERCAELRPLLSAAGDGEASPEDQRLVAAHLRACHPCRAVLRGYRAVPSRIAELLPPAALAPALVKTGWLSRLLDAATVTTGERAAALGHKVQAAGDALSAQKAAAVVASTAALAGGAVAERADRHDRDAHRAKTSIARPGTPAAPSATIRGPEPHPAQAPAAEGDPSHAAPVAAEAPQQPEPAGEFTPEAGAVTGEASAVTGEASAGEAGGPRTTGAAVAGSEAEAAASPGGQPAGGPPGERSSGGEFGP